ncbi:hypothetical protein H633G_11167 [Metarhizium anisopliae BRIP 53284]|nr:hypothetical protein H633G_11167 [Metarhizium anisopliae BRIP 53284]
MPSRLACEARESESVFLRLHPIMDGYGIRSNEPSPAAPLGVMEVPSHKISTPENFEEAASELSSSIHELDLGSGQIYEPHPNASTDRGDYFARRDLPRGP